MAAASVAAPMEPSAITAFDAFATAYGWDADTEEDDPLRESPALNRQTTETHKPERTP